MGKLKRVIEHLLVLATFNLCRISQLLGCIQLLLPELEKTFELVPSVPKGTHSVHVEGVLSLADCAVSRLLSSDMDFLVRFTTVLFLRV